MTLSKLSSLCLASLLTGIWTLGGVDFLSANDTSMLVGDWVPDDPHEIEFDRLPRLDSDHIVISDVRASDGVNQHNYLAWHHDKFWIMWSDGPGVEDQVGQRIKYATSDDGVNWTDGTYLTPAPPKSAVDSPHYGTRNPAGYRWIARGFWQREGELIALGSLDEAAGFFGPSLALHAFRWQRSDQSWQSLGFIADNTINNFPPQRLAGGKWMMSRRTYDYKRVGVHFLVGGDQRIDQWDSYPVLASSSELSAEEPLWWQLPDGNLMALFRDNRRSGFLYRSFSPPDGSSWSKPVRTNFPDATSKLHGIRLTDGRYVLVSNANPKQRDPLVLSVSDDGRSFHKMYYLVGGRRVDYPHVMQRGDQLFVAFSGGKQSVELLRVDIDRFRTDAE